MHSYNGLRVLLVEQEFPQWRRARNWSYTSQLAIEEGFRAHGVEFFTITTPWLRRARTICQGRKFDQVWVELVHSPLDDNCLKWIAGLAPVRVGLAAESLEYTAEECAVFPILAARRYEVEGRLKYLTHVLLGDEKDAERIGAQGSVRAMWWPQAIPARFISEDTATRISKNAMFSGALYGERASWLEMPELKEALIHQPSPEQGTLFPSWFDGLHIATSCYLKSRLPGAGLTLPVYLSFLRRLRRRCFVRWLDSMRSCCAVVNLPSFFKSYPGRVVEAMAAGQPVISWEIPDRPRTKALFRDGEEILFYPQNDPAKLAAHVNRLVAEPELGRRIAANARRKLKRFHTMETRVQQILDWVTTGETPTYG